MFLRFYTTLIWVATFISGITFSYSQETKSVSPSSNSITPKESPKSDAPETPTVSIKDVIPVVDTAAEMGIAVSPSTLRFNAKPGGSQTKTIKVSNDTKRAINFQINFQDFAAGADGQSNIPVEPDAKNALSKYLVISPTLVELKPRESKLISVTLDLPAGDVSQIAMWTTLTIDQMNERPKLESPDINSNTLGLGITAGIGFGVNVHQNPPNVEANKVEIQSLKYEKATDKKPHSLYMKAKNSGDGIGYCLYYIELTNLISGKQIKLKVKQFGVLPGYEKSFNFDLPADLEKGKYSALAVLDFGNKEELQTAELDFVIE
jgi:P pilus assembly chaperone PapD